MRLRNPQCQGQAFLPRVICGDNSVSRGYLSTGAILSTNSCWQRKNSLLIGKHCAFQVASGSRETEPFENTVPFKRQNGTNSALHTNLVRQLKALHTRLDERPLFVLTVTLRQILECRAGRVDDASIMRPPRPRFWWDRKAWAKGRTQMVRCCRCVYDRPPTTI